MAHEATNWAYKLDLPMTQKFILVALSDRADEEFSCFPGQKTLATMTGSSVATVRRALKELETAGYISRKQRRRDDGYRTSDRYFLAVGFSPSNVSDEPVEDGSHRSSDATSPLTQSTLTAHSGGDKEPSVNHQGIISGAATPPKPKRGTQIMPEFWYSPEMEAWAKKETPLVQEIGTQTQQFIDHHTARGSVMKDWNAAWRTWMRNSNKWALERNPQAGKPSMDWMKR